MAFIKDKSTGAMREIHKLLLNTLYGRMGMSNSPQVIKLGTPKEIEQILRTNHMIDHFKINDDLEYIRYHRKPDENLCKQCDEDQARAGLSLPRRMLSSRKLTSNVTRTIS